MKLWIARNKNGLLELFYKEPHYDKSHEIYCDSWRGGYYIGDIPKDMFPEVTFENSPQKVKLELVR